MLRLRTTKLNLPGLQLKLIGAFVALFVFGQVFQYVLLTSALATLATQMPEDGLRLLDELGPLVISNVLWTMCAILPLTLAIGLLVTHRLAGPIWRLSRYLEEVIGGKRPPDCKLRRGDELHDLCALINAATAPVRRAPANPTADSTPMEIQAPLPAVEKPVESQRAG
ncbi:MAG: hypothetical protein IPK67_01305 [Planctomycetes bacterium]|nr:hypothetical protein [Planctomycetota bacterium]